jgi:hypothetical protein
MHLRFRIVFVAVLAALAFGACSTEADDEDLPVQTITWEVKDGYYQFYTNDAKYYDYAFWSHRDNSTGVFTTFTGVTKKMSGGDHMGYGFIFCVVDNENFYRILITKNGSYRISKVVADTWTHLTDWVDSSNLKKDYGVENTVTVTRSAAGVFSIIFNDVQSATFTDTTFTTDAYGPYAAVGLAEDEAFPNSPVDLRYKFTSPAVSPSAVSKSLFSVAEEWSETVGFAKEVQQ